MSEQNLSQEISSDLITILSLSALQGFLYQLSEPSPALLKEQLWAAPLLPFPCLHFPLSLEDLILLCGFLTL